MLFYDLLIYKLLKKSFEFNINFINFQVVLRKIQKNINNN